MKIEILGKIKLEPMKDHFKISDPFSFIVDDDIYIVDNLNTDLGSIPKIFRIIFDRFGIETKSYVLHDFGYRVQPEGKNRKYWDDVLKCQQQKDKVNKIKSYLIYKTLRSFGWIAWNENKKKLKGDLFG